MNHIQTSPTISRPGLLLVLTLTLLLIPGTQAQQPQPAASATATIKGGAEEVVLDVVIRDKKGKELADLSPDDLEVSDDGNKQQIKSFRRVEGREAIARGSKTILDPLRQIRLVTLLFEGLSPTGRQFAKQAALDLVKASQAQNVFFSVMTLDFKLNALQQFTSDKDKLKRAIEKATGGTFTDFAADSARIEEELRREIGAGADSRPIDQQISDATAAANPQTDAGGFVQSRMAGVMLETLRINQASSREEASRISITGLSNVVRGNMRLPGRKTILYFSEGLRVPTFLDSPFSALVSAANRANVSFYCLDARGVGAGGTGDARGSLANAATSSRNALNNDGAVKRDEVVAADTAEEGMRGDLQAKLREMAESTGGFLISDTNDLKTPLRRINEEINGYYEITYSPHIENYDGRFRKINVKLLRGDAKVFTRTGYFALPLLKGGAGESLQPFEVPLLTALSTSPLPKNLVYQSSIVRFQQADEITTAALIIDVPFSSLVFNENKTKNTFKLHLSLMALLKDSKGDVVRKFDRDLPLEYPLDRIADAKGANFQYNEVFSVIPGRYTLETAVMDRNGEKIGARRMSFIASAKPKGVALSGLSLVRKYEPKAKNLGPDEPFQFQGGRVTPTLNGTVRQMKGALLSLFFVVYPDPSITEKPQAMVEFLLDGKSVGGGVVQLPEPDAKGRISYVLSSPAETFKPGTYEVHAVVKQGGTAAEDRTVVTIEGQ